MTVLATEDTEVTEKREGKKVGKNFSTPSYVLTLISS
jgi:hypothetical protein